MKYFEKRIKRAMGDYTCAKCRNIIHEGTDYMDCSYKTYDLKKKEHWLHDRFHKECYSSQVGDNTIIDKVFNKLKDEGFFYMGNPKGEKVFVQGILFDRTNTPYIICREWEDKSVYYETVENFKNYIDYKGDTL